MNRCADGDDGRRQTAKEGGKALLCPRHIVQQTKFSTLVYDHTHKNKMQLSTRSREKQALDNQLDKNQSI